MELADESIGPGGEWAEPDGDRRSAGDDLLDMKIVALELLGVASWFSIVSSTFWSAGMVSSAGTK